MLISATRDGSHRIPAQASQPADVLDAGPRPAAETGSVTGTLTGGETGTVTGAVTGRLPLSALLSQVLVAFIIECDNEIERQMPHSTTSHGRTPGAPWLVSMPDVVECLRFAGEEPITVGN